MYEESSVFNSIERRQGKEETRAFFQLKQNTGERNNPYMRITPKFTLYTSPIIRWEKRSHFPLWN